MDTVKAEKETAMRRYHRLRRLGLALRCVEACAALLALSWCSARLPHAVRLLRDAAALLLAPAFVFLLGNAIVLVLLAKFRHRSPSSSSSPEGTDLYAILLHVPDRDTPFIPPAAGPEAEPTPVVAAIEEEKEEVPELRRTRSAGARRKRVGKELRRAETVVVERRGEEGRESVEMSPKEAEEFRRRVESFIAKQRWFQEEEEEEAVGVVAAWASPEQLVLAES